MEYSVWMSQMEHDGKEHTLPRRVVEYFSLELMSIEETLHFVNNNFYLRLRKRLFVKFCNFMSYLTITLIFPFQVFHLYSPFQFEFHIGMQWGGKSQHTIPCQSHYSLFLGQQETFIPICICGINKV